MVPIVDWLENGDEDWQQQAVKRDPTSLRAISQMSICKAIQFVTKLDIHTEMDNLRRLGNLLKTSLPLETRTSLFCEMVSGQTISTSSQVSSLIAFYISADLKYLSICASIKEGNYVSLTSEECIILRQELQDVTYLTLETLELDGIQLESKLLLEMLQHASRLQSIHVSGTLCVDVLDFLKTNSLGLTSITFDNSAMTDQDLINAIPGLLNSSQDFGVTTSTINKRIESNCSFQESLLSLEIHSPYLTIYCAIMVFQFFKNLRHFKFNFWTAGEILPLIKHDFPNVPPSSFTSMDLFRPTENEVAGLTDMCPHLKKIMMECYSPSLRSLEILSHFKDLTSLRFRYISDSLVSSAAKSLGDRLKDLCIEYEDFTHHPFSEETLWVLQESCPFLKRLVMRNVGFITKGERETSTHKKTKLFPEMKELHLSHVDINAVTLQRFLIGNKMLIRLNLSTNSDAITDSLILTLCKNNPFVKLETISIDSGMLTVNAITSLVCLPALKKLSVSFGKFSHITDSTFRTLKQTFSEHNCQCILEDTTVES